MKDKAIASRAKAIASRANGWIYVVSLLWSHYCSMVRGNTASEAEACYEMLRNPCTWDDTENRKDCTRFRAMCPVFGEYWKFNDNKHIKSIVRMFEVPTIVMEDHAAIFLG